MNGGDHYAAQPDAAHESEKTDENHLDSVSNVVRNKDYRRIDRMNNYKNYVNGNEKRE